MIPLVQIIVPHWACYSQHKDPTHVKSYSQESVDYLCGNATTPEYGYNFKFDLVQLIETLTPEGQKLEGKELEFAKKHYLNIIYNLVFLLRAIK